MGRVAVIGAGAMGLAAAYHAAKAGHHVTVFEAGPEPGGMAGHFDFGGLSLERYYHFVCKADQPTFALLEELGLGDAMRWQATSMGYFIGGRLHPWGDPISLLAFPELDLISKIRYGLLMFLSTRRERWDALETQSAKEWIIRWCGHKVYDRLWHPLFALKFYEYADNISAAWIWTRIKRVGRSRRSLFQEELGHIEGGTETLIKALTAAIGRLGGEVRLSSPVEEIVTGGGAVRGVRAGGKEHAADAVISTMPTPFVSRLVPGLPAEWKRRYDAIGNIGVICLVFKLKRSVTPHFWVNIVEPDCPIPGIIEFSNLRKTPDTIVYVPYYMPTSNPRWTWTDKALAEEAFATIRRINPALTEADRLGLHVGRLRHAQPICPPGFAAMIPPVETPIRGLQIADTCFYYPEDRGISESVRFGKEMAARIEATENERTDGVL
jgi:protoporphyrinogen oxidase